MKSIYDDALAIIDNIYESDTVADFDYYDVKGLPLSWEVRWKVSRDELEKIRHALVQAKTLETKNKDLKHNYELINEVTVHPETLKQLESLIDNAKSFIDEEDEDRHDVWHKDIEVLTNTIEVIKAVLTLKGIDPDNLLKPQPGPDLFEIAEGDDIDE